jgi:hypothetical protein
MLRASHPLFLVDKPRPGALREFGEPRVEEKNLDTKLGLLESEGPRLPIRSVGSFCGSGPFSCSMLVLCSKDIWGLGT